MQTNKIEVKAGVAGGTEFSWLSRYGMWAYLDLIGKGMASCDVPRRGWLYEPESEITLVSIGYGGRDRDKPEAEGRV